MKRVGVFSKCFKQLQMLFNYCIYLTVFLFILKCSRDDVSDKLNKPNGCDEAVHIGNPKTAEFQVNLFALTCLIALLALRFSCSQIPNKT